jgi:hypothetical protein
MAAATARQPLPDHADGHVAVQALSQTDQTTGGAPAASPSATMPAFIKLSCAISEALASDKPRTSMDRCRAGAALAGIEKDYAAPHDLSSLVQPVLAAGKLQPAKELADARNSFCPLARPSSICPSNLERGQGVPNVKVYHCPTAPEPVYGSRPRVHSPIFLRLQNVALRGRSDPMKRKRFFSAALSSAMKNSGGGAAGDRMLRAEAECAEGETTNQ